MSRSSTALECCNSTIQRRREFSGTVAGFGQGADAIDIRGINSASAQVGFAENTAGTGGVLTVGDGSHSANIALLGNYMASSFAAASDGHGGTLISEAPAAAQQTALTQPHA